MKRTLLFALLTAAVVSAGCGGFPTEPDDYRFGRADVYVRDTAGANVDGAAVRLERTGGGVVDQGGLTGSVGLPGYYFFLVSPGTYRVVITPPAGFALEDGQPSFADVTLGKDQTKRIDFTLRRL